MSATKRFGRMAMAVTLLAVVGAPVSEAPAADSPGGCSGQWNVSSANYRTSGSGSCLFRLDGTPVYIYGAATAANDGADVEIEVWLHLNGHPLLTLDNRCENADKGQTFCSKEDVLVPYAVSPLLVEPRLPQIAGGTGLSVQCNWRWKGNRAGEAGCFGPDHCPSVANLDCQEVLGERLDCLLGLESCPDVSDGSTVTRG